MGTCICLLHGWRHVKGISRSISTIKTDWMITRQREEKGINSQEKYQTNSILSE
jgi:hypothetical protein